LGESISIRQVGRKGFRRSDRLDGDLRLSHIFSNILEKQEEMQRVARGRHKIEMLVKPFSYVIVGMDHESTNPRNLGRLKRP
jgi:hypothetical protein